MRLSLAARLPFDTLVGLDWRTIATYEAALQPAGAAEGVDWDKVTDPDTAWQRAQGGSGAR